jgi:hypothetical protein
MYDRNTFVVKHTRVPDMARALAAFECIRVCHAPDMSHAYVNACIIHIFST